jgi:glucose/arabinose dehydrogenase
MALIVGNDGIDTLQGTAGKDVIYGFDPNGPQGQVSSIAAIRVASGLNQPLFAISPPGDTTRLFIVEKTGLIKILDLTTGQVLPTPFLDLTSQITTAGEQGLLGLAFHPDYANNGLFYVQLTNPSGDNEIRSYHVSASNPNQADVASVMPVITIDMPNTSDHRAGWIGFGPDGFLYASEGDGATATGQTIDDLLGNILRIDVNSDAFPDLARNYAIPPDNPYAGPTDGADEIFAIGLCNPWRPSFDRALGDFYIADVGANSWEEVDLGQLGANYGWPIREGAHGGILTGATDPIFEYPHGGSGASITGGYVYRGPSEGLQGQYFFADFVTSKVFTLRHEGNSWVPTERTSQIMPDVGAISSPSSFGEDALGNLYIVDFNGEVFRLTPTVASADQGDVLSGLGGDDFLFGGSGNDTLNGGLGNDFLNGGPGTDSAIFSGMRSAYTLAALAGDAVRVVGPDGTDTLTSVERLVFDDQTLSWPPVFADPTHELAAFGPGAGGWSSNDTYPRQVADVNADGRADIVGFSQAGVYVSLATAGGHFAMPTFELAAFGVNAGGWSSDNTYPRKLADVNGDGRADIVGFGQSGVYVSLATAGGHFAAPTFELAAFGANAGGWTSDNTYPRELADVNGDGRADIVGFSQAGVYVSLATAGGHFAMPTFELAAFGANAGGWSSDNTYPRELADVNGDGRADIVGFGQAGVYVSLATAGGHFAAPTFELAAFGANAGGWTSDDLSPRKLADVNADGMADIVGFGAAGIYVSLATGGGHFAAPTMGLPAFGANAGGWSSDNTYPRELADVTADGKADIVGFSHAGVYLSESFFL